MKQRTVILLAVVSMFPASIALGQSAPYYDDEFCIAFSDSSSSFDDEAKPRLVGMSFASGHGGVGD